MAAVDPLADDDEPVPAYPPTAPVPVSAPHEDGSAFPPSRGPHGPSAEHGLERFLWIHPCTSFFAHMAHLQGTQDTAAARVTALRSGDRKFYWACVSVDLIFTVAASAALLATAGFLVWVTIWQPHLGG